MVFRKDCTTGSDGAKSGTAGDNHCSIILNTRGVLSKKQALEIFKCKIAKQGNRSLRITATGTAEKFHVSEKTVRDIWKGRTWTRETLALREELEALEALEDCTTDTMERLDLKVFAKDRSSSEGLGRGTDAPINVQVCKNFDQIGSEDAYHASEYKMFVSHLVHCDELSRKLEHQNEVDIHGEERQTSPRSIESTVESHPSSCELTGCSVLGDLPDAAIFTTNSESPQPTSNQAVSTHPELPSRCHLGLLALVQAASAHCAPPLPSGESPRVVQGLHHPSRDLPSARATPAPPPTSLLEASSPAASAIFLSMLAGSARPLVWPETLGRSEFSAGMPGYSPWHVWGVPPEAWLRAGRDELMRGRAAMAAWGAR